MLFLVLQSSAVVAQGLRQVIDPHWKRGMSYLKIGWNFQLLSFVSQAGVGDITYIRLGQEFVYLAVLMDLFTRSIRGWHLARSMDQSLTITALEKAFENGTPQIHHTDQGVHFMIPI